MEYIEKFKNFMNSDWKKIVLNWWNNVSPVSKKSFLWIFGIINLVFLWHTITFFFGNHDWTQIKSGVRVAWSLWDGRWGAGIIQQFTGGDILPVWNNLFCFTGFTLGVIFLAKYWELPKNTFIYTIFGLFIILMPYTPPWMQFVRSETHFWNVFLIIFALYICNYKKIWSYCLAFLLLFFCLGCYAAMLPAMVIIFLGRCVLDVWFENKTWSELVKERLATAGIIVFAFVSFTATWIIMKQLHIIIPIPTVKTVGFNTLFHNFMYIWENICNTFLCAIPYISTAFKMLLGLSIPIVLLLMKNFSDKKVVLLFLLFSGIIVSTQIINLLSVNDYSNQLRIDFWAMPYTYALFWAILLRIGRCWENIAILFMCIAIFYSGLQDVRDQKVKYFDKLRDMRIFEDVVTRIKNNPKFDPNNQYNVLIIGDVANISKKTTFDKYNQNVSWQNSWSPFVANWNAQEYFNFYEKKPFVNVSYSDAYISLQDNDLRTMDINYLSNVAKPYPNLNSVHLDENYIYIIFEQDELAKLKKRIKNVMQKG